MKKQITYLPLIPRLFTTTLDLLFLSFFTPFIEIPLYKILYNYFFNDFVLIPQVDSNKFPFENTFNVNEFFSYLSEKHKLTAYITFILLLGAIKFCIIGAYFVSMWYYSGATFGKMVLKMKIVDSRTFARPTLTQLIIRFCGYIIAPVGLWTIIFNPQKQALHDKLAGTIVIKS